MKRNYLLDKVKSFLSQNSVNIGNDQYFLIDHSVIQKLIMVSKVNKDDRVLEIGTGLGFLTENLAKKAKEIISIEVDKRFQPYLKTLPKNA